MCVYDLAVHKPHIDCDKEPNCQQSVAHVVQDWEESPDLAKWVGRQRVARAQGGLSEERLQVLYAMGFEFGEVAQLTDAWEAKFDQLIEWVLWQVPNRRTANVSHK